MAKTWIAFFSDEGNEIVELVKRLKRYPDLIVTNERKPGVRTIVSELKESGTLVTIPTNPTTEHYGEVLDYYDSPLISLHNWSEEVPTEIIKKGSIFKMQTVLETKYPEIKIEEGFEKSLKGKNLAMGCMLCKLRESADKNKIVSEVKFNGFQITKQQYIETIADRSEYLWHNFLKDTL